MFEGIEEDENQGKKGDAMGTVKGIKKLLQTFRGFAVLVRNEDGHEQPVMHEAGYPLTFSTADEAAEARDQKALGGRVCWVNIEHFAEYVFEWEGAGTTPSQVSPERANG